MSTSVTVSIPSRDMADVYVNVVKDTLKDDPLKKPKSVIHLFLRRLYLYNAEALRHDAPALLQLFYKINSLKSFLK